MMIFRFSLYASLIFTFFNDFLFISVNVLMRDPRRQDVEAAAERSISWQAASAARRQQDATRREGERGQPPAQVQASASSAQVQVHREEQRRQPAARGEANREVSVTRFAASASLGDLRQPPQVSFSAYWRRSEMVPPRSMPAIPTDAEVTERNEAPVAPGPPVSP